MTEAATINTQLIDTLTQIILALTEEERHILIHKLLTPNQTSDTTKADRETLFAGNRDRSRAASDRTIYRVRRLFWAESSHDYKTTPKTELLNVSLDRSR